MSAKKGSLRSCLISRVRLIIAAYRDHGQVARATIMQNASNLMPSRPIELGYSPREPQQWPWRKWILAFVVGACVILLVRSWSILVRRAKLLYYQHAAESFVQPANISLYTNSMGQSAWNSNSSTAADHLLQLMYQFYLVKHGTLFSHGMTRPDGKRRLVILSLTGDVLTKYNQTQGAITPEVIALGNAWTDPKEFPSITVMNSIPYYQKSLVVHPGQPDPTDPSHFTFVCDIDGNPVIMDGWLRNDDTVVLEERTPTPPPSSSPALSR